MEILWKVDMFAAADSKNYSEQEYNMRDNSGDQTFQSPFDQTSNSSTKPPSRESTLSNIVEFEENRRLVNESHMIRNELYWNELMKMLEEAVLDTDHLYHYLKCKFAALVAFADALNSIQFDHICRGKHLDNELTSMEGLTSSVEFSCLHKGPGLKARQALVSLDKMWAQRISTLSEKMNKEIMQPLDIVKKSFIDDIRAMGRRCANVFHAVRLSDQRVHIYFSAVDGRAQNSPVRMSSLRRLTPSHSSISLGAMRTASSSSIQVAGPLQTCHAVQEEPKDMWLLDMCYRVAVVRNLQMREECSRQLGRLLLRAKEAETRRREAIASAAEQLSKIQGDLWMHLPVAAASLDEMRDQIANMALNSDISVLLRERVAAIQAEPAEADHASPLEETKEARDRDRYDDELWRLSSPLQSPLLVKCSVSVRRDGGPIVVTWTPVLLFLTTDRWLHIYDLDPKCERMSEVAAFHSLVSSSKRGLELSVVSSAHTTVCEETEFDPNTSTQLLKNEAFMAPTHSLLLPRCRVACKPSVNDTTFEVIEAVPNTGMGAMFKSTVERRYVFRSRSEEEMTEWVVKLKGESS